MNRDKIHPLICSLIPLIGPIQKSLGPFSEVVLHDFQDLNHSIVAISGNITGRYLEGSITNLVLTQLRKGNVNDLINYENRLRDGRILRSSTIYIRDEKKNPVGCLCFNFDITVTIAVKEFIDASTRVEKIGEKLNVEENFSHDIDDMVERILESALEQIRTPIAMMQKKDKLELIKILEGKGIFLIKGAIEKIARSLSVSRYTIYNYIKEVRGMG